MAQRAKVIAEIASNHSGSWSICHDLIAAAADAGADIVKLQLYDATTLRDDDPQKAWLLKAQVTRPMLDSMLTVAAEYNVQLTASVFGIPQAQMAKDAGLTTIKIGSGEYNRPELAGVCCDLFRGVGTVWIGRGLGEMPFDHRVVSALNSNEGDRRVVYFRGVSQYPTPYFRGLARLTQIPKPKSGWGWSDHGENIEVCKEAALHGATYIERHFSMPFAPRQSAWDSDAASLRELRDFCEEVAWEGSDEHREACDKFLTRWSGQ